MFKVCLSSVKEIQLNVGWMSVDRSHITTFLTYNAQIHEGSVRSVHKHTPSHIINELRTLHIERLFALDSRNLHISWASAHIKHCMHNMDSDLEAFNRNPTHGSIATLAYRLAAFALCMN